MSSWQHASTLTPTLTQTLTLTLALTEDEQLAACWQPGGPRRGAQRTQPLAQGREAARRGLAAGRAVHAGTRAGGGGGDGGVRRRDKEGGAAQRSVQRCAPGRAGHEHAEEDARTWARVNCSG